MKYLRCLKGVSISIIVILILLLLLQVIGEEKLSTDTSEGNTESVKDDGATDYTISIRTTGDKMTLYTDSKLIGRTPLMLTLKEGELLQIFGKNKKGDVILKTTLEGGKTPSGLIIQHDDPGLGIKAGLVILGVSIGVVSQLLWIIIALSREMG
ncbi:MAG: hypothetical protein ACUVWP_01400 [bacterium]